MSPTTSLRDFRSVRRVLQILAHHQDAAAAGDGADGAAFAMIVFDARPAAVHVADGGRGVLQQGQAVGFGVGVEVIIGDGAAAARHVLHDGDRIAGQILRQELRDQAARRVGAAAGARRD